MKKAKIINVIIAVVFLIVSFFIGSNHEPWADEAQSWIIARDASVIDIIWDLARYEGSFPLWHLTLKLFISFGLTYEYLYIVPIIISFIGLIVFLKKVEAPTYVKILLPFTYYIFYQYTIIARSYCYLFLAFSFLMIAYRKRKEQTLKYIFSLIFMSFISMHGMLISCGLITMLIKEMIQEKTIKQHIKEILIFVVCIFFEIAILFPPNDIYMTVSANLELKENINMIVNVLIGNGGILKKIYNFISLILLIILLKDLIRLKNKGFIFVFVAMMLFMFTIRFANHHSGILFLLIVFEILINYEEIKKNNKYIDKILLIALIIYCIYSCVASMNDYLYQYSGAKQMANYIKTNGYDEKEIFGFGFKDVALQPYFEENLYKNMDEAIHKWSTQNENFYIYCNFEEYERSDFKEVPEYIVLEWNDTDIRLGMIESVIEETGKYEIEYQTMGYQFFKNWYSEREGYTLFKLKE